MADNTNIHVDNYPITLSLKAILTRWNLGLMLLRVVVVLWVVSGFLINVSELMYSWSPIDRHLNLQTTIRAYLNPIFTENRI